MTQPITLYHNPRCSKSRQALALLEGRGLTPTVILYLETPPSPKELTDLIKKLGIPPRDLLRKGEEEYQTSGAANPQLTDAELIRLMTQHPKLIERPIVVAGNKAVIARPPERALELL